MNNDRALADLLAELDRELERRASDPAPPGGPAPWPVCGSAAVPSDAPTARCGVPLHEAA